MRLLLLLPIALVAAGCQSSEDAQLVSVAKAAIAKQIREPASAMFRDVRPARDDVSRRIGMVCGEVSGRNKLGAQSDFRRFLYGRDAGLAQIEYSASEAATFGSAGAVNRGLFRQSWEESC